MKFTRFRLWSMGRRMGCIRSPSLTWMPLGWARYLSQYKFPKSTKQFAVSVRGATHDWFYGELSLHWKHWTPPRAGVSVPDGKCLPIYLGLYPAQLLVRSDHRRGCAGREYSSVCCHPDPWFILVKFPTVYTFIIWGPYFSSIVCSDRRLTCRTVGKIHPNAAGICGNFYRGIPQLSFSGEADPEPEG